VGGVVVVDLVDGVKPGVDDEITGTINQLLDQGHRQFVLNLERVSVLDSAGLGDVVRAYTAVNRHGGTLRLEGVNQRLHDVLGLTKFAGRFEAGPFPDPFNPKLRDTYRTGVLAASSLMLVAIVIMIIWIWGGLSGGP
jgi:anti-sigma B factor antagonist